MGKNISHYIISITNMRKTYTCGTISPKYLQEALVPILVTAVQLRISGIRYRKTTRIEEKRKIGEEEIKNT